MGNFLPSLGDAIAFLEALSSNVYAILGFVSTLATFVPGLMSRWLKGRFGRWLSSKPENKRLVLLALGASLLLWASFQAFSDEREKLRQAEVREQAEKQQAQTELQQMRDQLAAMQNMLAGRTSHQFQVMQQLSRFHGEAMALLSAYVTKDEYPLWKDKQEKLENESAAWIQQNIGTEAREQLLDMGGFVTGVYSYVGDTDRRDRMIRLEKLARNILALMQDEAANAASLHGSPR